MARRNRNLWMWAEACELLERAERLQRRFFALGVPEAQRPCWEPPVDILETRDDLWVQVALPGVQPDSLELRAEDGVLVVRAERRLPTGAPGSAIHRLEIPHGRFERRIELPAGRFELVNHELAYGCLLLRLRKTND